MREVVRFVQSARKEAGLNVDDRISLSLNTNAEDVAQAIEKYKKEIRSETLAVKLDDTAEYSFKAEVKLEDQTLIISLQKAE